MSRLDNIILECINKALAGKEEKLGDYVDPTKEEVKALVVELIGEDDMIDSRRPSSQFNQGKNRLRAELRKKVETL